MDFVEGVVSKSGFPDRGAHHGWEGREHFAYEADVAGFELTAAGTFDGSECLVIVRVPDWSRCRCGFETRMDG